MREIVTLLIFAVSGIISWRLMGRVDRFIDRYTDGSDKPEREKKKDESAEDGESEHAHPRMPFFLHVQRKGHPRCF